jgi:hypothetical protein
VFVDDFDNCVIRNTKSVGIMWRKCQLKRKILVGRADIVTWWSRYLKEVQEYGGNGHLMFYTHKTWTDRQQLNISQLLARRLSLRYPYSCQLRKQAIMLQIGGICGFLPLCTPFTRLDAKQETIMDK